MQSELSVLKAFLSYETWNEYNSYVKSSDFPEDLQGLYRCLDSWHKTQNEDSSDLHLLDLSNIYFSQNKGNKAFFEKVFDNLDSYTPNLKTVRELLTSIKRNSVLRELSLASYDVVEGKKPYEAVQKLLASLGDTVEAAEEQESPFVTDDLSSLLDATYKTPGLRWRLNALNRSLGSLRKGDFGFIQARPETGKTTFLASELTFMAEQADGPILLLNNEGVNEKLKARIYQAFLGVTMQELLADPARWDAIYNKAMKGKILIPKQGSYSRWDVEKLCKRYKPALIAIDQLTKITGFEGARDDLELGAKFQWGRDLAMEFAPVIGVSQADGQAENKKWLTMQHTANSKTSVAAEADWILGIGHIHDTGFEDFRFLNISKNKLLGDDRTDPALRHGKLTVKIDAPRARYVDFQ
jgi:replicative DNA helicase